MAYETGTASDMADLLAKLQTFLQANGWTLTGNVLSKGACYTSLAVDATPSRIAVLGGTGYSSGLTGAAPGASYFGSPASAVPLVFPLTYHFHAHGDEAYALINWSSHYWTYLGFGASPVPGLPGTGGWTTTSYGGTQPVNVAWGGGGYYHAAFVLGGGYNGTGPFWAPPQSENSNSYVHHGLDGGGWSTIRGGSPSNPGTAAVSVATSGPTILRTPNAWNGEAVLAPLHPYITRGSNKVSIIAELQHARVLNMANLSPEDVLTLGPDQWRVYPFYRKGGANPAATDSGPLGLAVRYDGP